MHPTAYADQLAAAARDALRVLHAAATAGVGHLTTDDPWVLDQAAALVAELAAGRVRPCPHLGPSPRVAQAAVWAPGRLVCPACAPLLRPDPIEDATCDHCRRLVRHVHAGMVAIGPVLLGYGRCDTCTPTDDHPPSPTSRVTSNHTPPKTRPRRPAKRAR